MRAGAQGQGIGTALMETIIDRARAFGFRQMIGVITAESAGSLRLHEKLGFRVVATTKRSAFKFDRWLDIVHMQRGCSRDERSRRTPPPFHARIGALPDGLDKRTAVGPM